MQIIGLTGGIASGKSTVARMLCDLSAPVLDADLVAREVVLPGTPALAAIVDQFGPAFLDGKGELDRKKLGALVFSDPEKRRALNAIVLPQVAAATAQKMAAWRAAGVPIAIYEAALLVENNVHAGLDGLIVVQLDEATQLQRLRARDRLSDTEARDRLEAQLPLSAKLAVADFVIDNSADERTTRLQTEAIWKKLQDGWKRT